MYLSTVLNYILGVLKYMYLSTLYFKLLSTYIKVVQIKHLFLTSNSALWKTFHFDSLSLCFINNDVIIYKTFVIDLLVPMFIFLHIFNFNNVRPNQ